MLMLLFGWCRRCGCLSYCFDGCDVGVGLIYSTCVVVLFIVFGVIVVAGYGVGVGVVAGVANAGCVGCVVIVVGFYAICADAAAIPCVVAFIGLVCLVCWRWCSCYRYCFLCCYMCCCVSGCCCHLLCCSSCYH